MTGAVDWLWDVPKDQAERIEANPAITVESAKTLRVAYLQFDVTGQSGQKFFVDKRVRQAIAHAIDREAITKNLVGPASEAVIGDFVKVGLKPRLNYVQYTAFTENVHKGHTLSRAISDAGWHSLTSKIAYKAERAGKYPVKLDRFAATSKTCPCCGEKADQVPLSVRSFVCGNCGSDHDRDVNAAKASSH